ncbi:MAG: hypothetical protein PVS3B1_27690 [Ktedonobacteraceae bacterium]
MIERRKGWFAPAVVLVGLLAQLHGSGFLLAAPLAVAFVLSPGTIRVRDIVFGLLGLLILYSTYALWLVHSHFRDIPIFLNSTKGPSIIDNQALLFFQQFLSPYGFDPNNIPLTNPRSLLFRLSPLLSILTVLMIVLVACSAIMALVLAVRTVQTVRTRETESDVRRRGGWFVAWHVSMLWWRELCAAPYRCALWVLLSWQLVPLVYLLRHSIKLFAHYFIMLMPGPFILLAIFLVNVIDWTKLRATWGRGVLFGIYGLVALLIAAQSLGGLALVLDTARGNFNADYNRFNALSSLQHAFGEADQLAQSRHLQRVYVSTDEIRRAASYYLAEQMHTPTTVFDDSCAMLPGAAAGSAVLLTSPDSDLTAALTARFATITLVDQPARLGGAPFRLYLVEPLSLVPAQYEMLGRDVQFLGAKNSKLVHFQQDAQLVTRWEFLQAKSPASNITYTYRFESHLGSQQNSSQCVLTAVQPGDQLLVPLVLPVPQRGARPGSMNVQVQAFMTRPDTLSIHPTSQLALTFDTYNRVDTPHTTLQATDGKKTISVASP